jgi:hypothetical protein
MKPDFSPIPFAKIQIVFNSPTSLPKNLQNHSTFNRFYVKRGEKRQKVWKIKEKCLSLHIESKSCEDDVYG